MAPSDSRPRSRSPSRPKKSAGGFKWKDKTRKPDDAKPSYRERSPKYDSTRPRDHDHDHDRDGERRHRRRNDDADDEGRPRERSDKALTSTTESKRRAPAPAPVLAAADPGPVVLDRKSTAAKFGARAAAAVVRKPAASNKDDAALAKGPKEEVAEDPLAAPKYTAPPSSEPMIIVHVNDRLGTKAAIPCLASDPVRAFKAMVAARIGRQPHEILIKRQGERPFKDQLSLEDYGVSNGVQLDLELDTGE